MANNKTNKISQQSSAFQRPAVVVVLGHVDHGKTTLLDAVRKTDVAGKEYGGITQSIGAYQIQVEAGTTGKGQEKAGTRKITFIDTPGHEAFSNMRSRGASVADIAVLVVAANDSVMPQTVESIKIIKEAKIPFIVAINKVDLPEANIDKVIQDLLRHEVLLENYGGDVPFVKVSAKKSQGVKELLDLIGLVADMNELSGDPRGNLQATVIESRMDKNRGPLATVIVKNGVIKVGDKVYIDRAEDKIRALIDYNNESVKEARPGDPVEILGLSTVPPVGALVGSIPTSAPEKLIEVTNAPGLSRSNVESGQSLGLIIKADTLGSLEAIQPKIPVNVNLLSRGVGEVSEADVLLARSTKSIILGFNVKVTPAATKLAEAEKVLVRTYKIIYELLDELDDAAAGMLEPIEIEEELGTGKIIAEFPYEKLRIAGTRVAEGRIARGDQVKIVRSGLEENEGIVGRSKIKSVRVGKEETNKVESGKECGIFLDPQVDFRVGDDIISYRIV